MDYDYLQFLVASGFQKSDESHPAGSGKPGYRLVYKSLKLLPLPTGKLEWPNLRVRFLVGSTSIGGIKAKGGLKSRRPNMVILPEYIQIDQNGNTTNFVGQTNMKFEYKAWEKEIPKSGLVEFLYFTEASKPEDVLSEGRLQIDKLKVILELAAGTRLLGVPLAEEVVEIFPDWHWNRNMSSLSVASESELNMERLNTEEFVHEIKLAIESTQVPVQAERRRIAVAANWYWKAESELDYVNRFIEYWIGVEALEMPNTTNIRPVKKRLEEITGIEEDKWSEPVGKLFGLRSELVHGKQRNVSKNEIQMLRYLLLTLFQGRLFPGTQHEVIEKLKESSGLGN